MAQSPLDLGNSMARTLSATQRAVKAGIREAMLEVGKNARTELNAVAPEVPGSDKRFSGTQKYNGGRLGVKVRYEYDEAVVRVSPMGPWGLPAGRGRTKAGLKSWDKGETATKASAERTVPKKITAAVEEGFKRG